MLAAKAESWVTPSPRADRARASARVLAPSPAPRGSGAEPPLGVAERRTSCTRGRRRATATEDRAKFGSG